MRETGGQEWRDKRGGKTGEKEGREEGRGRGPSKMGLAHHTE